MNRQLRPAEKAAQMDAARRDGVTAQVFLEGNCWVVRDTLNYGAVAAFSDAGEADNFAEGYRHSITPVFLPARDENPETD